MESPSQQGAKNLGFERLIFFSDAVFAIAITLLVLDIQLPANLKPTDVPGALFRVIPQIAAYILSFFVIGAYWLAHHRFYQHIVRFDSRLLWLNLLLLLFVAFIPFPTRAVAEYGNTQAVVIVYAATIALTGLVMLANWWYVAGGHRLVEPDLDPDLITWIYLRHLLFPLLFLVSIGVSFIPKSGPGLAVYVWYLAAVAVALTSARPLTRRKRQP